MFAWINEEFRIDSKVPSPFKPGFRKFMTGSFRLRKGIISVVIGGHFGGRDHFDGGTDVSNQGSLLLLNNGLTSPAILIIYWFSFTDFTDLGRFKALFVELPGFFSFSLMLSKQEPLKLQHVADLRLQALFGTVSILPRTQTTLSPWKFGRKGRRERENGRDVTSQ